MPQARRTKSHGSVAGSEERQDGNWQGPEQEDTEGKGRALKGGPSRMSPVTFGELQATWRAVQPEPNVPIFFIIPALGVGQRVQRGAFAKLHRSVDQPLERRSDESLPC